MTIRTRLGEVQGLVGQGVDSFLGLRYAAPPTGTRRFAPPQQAAPWTGVYDATHFPNRAPQPPLPEFFGTMGPGNQDEDCLFLNIYTPGVDAKPRPVLVWIHGGSLQMGSANDYDGGNLAKQSDIVVVCINYRLGLLGFVDLSRFGAELAGSACNGIRDQIAALEWVRDNISDYGGDPGNITIAGESAGGGSVLALLAAPSADGLYHRAIAISPGGFTKPPLDAVPALASTLDVEASGLMPRLRELSAEDLLAAQVTSALPLAEGGIDGVVVTRSPFEAIRERGRAGVPLIAGSTRDEGTLFTAILPDDPEVISSFTAIAASVLMAGSDSTGYLESLRSLYPAASPAHIGELVLTDMIRRPSIAAVDAATSAGAGGWLYRFDLPTTALEGQLGSPHGWDIPFIFNDFNPAATIPMFRADRDDPHVIKLAEAWSKTLAQFARTGDPNGAGLPHWPQYSGLDPRCLVLDAECHVEDNLDEAHRKLWGD